MHLLKFDPEARTLDEVPGGRFHADPACHYFYVQAKRCTVPILTETGLREIVWQHPDYKPPVTEVKLRRRPWIMRLLRFPHTVWRTMRAGGGLSLWRAIRLSKVTLRMRWHK